MTVEMKKLYHEKVVPSLQKEFSIKNIMAVPKIVKVVVSSGVGDAILNNQALDDASKEISLITGQKPLVTKAKKSEAGFKLREGMKIGLKVTLRHQRMYAFLERLIKVALPRTRDFRGVLETSFDKKGNYNLGIREATIFPEIPFETVDKIRGLQVTIVTTSTNDEQSFFLLSQLGMPFRKKEQ